MAYFTLTLWFLLSPSSDKFPLTQIRTLTQGSRMRPRAKRVSGAAGCHGGGPADTGVQWQGSSGGIPETVIGMSRTSRIYMCVLNGLLPSMVL